MSGSHDLIRVAENDQLFIRYREKNCLVMTFQAILRRIYGVHQALGVIDVIKGKLSPDDPGGLDETLLANLEYLLLCIQGRLIEVDLWNAVQIAIRSSRNSLGKASKFGSSKWMSEYADNKPPLSTTWPWCIRPALAVLWGVCWMFYDSPQESPVPRSSRFRYGKSRSDLQGWPLQKKARESKSQLGACPQLHVGVRSQSKIRLKLP
jgi:hypothetical protein